MNTVIQLLYAIVAIGGYFKIERAVNPKQSISLSACYSFLNRHCLDEQGKRGQNVPLRYYWTNSIGAANWLFNQAMPCKPHSHPANQIRHAYSGYEYVPANILALTYPFRHYKKCATLRLIFETMPIYKAVASGNGNIEFYRETTCSNLTLDRHDARQNLNYYILPDPPLFSLPSTFN